MKFEFFLNFEVKKQFIRLFQNIEFKIENRQIE